MPPPMMATRRTLFSDMLFLRRKSREEQRGRNEDGKAILELGARDAKNGINWADDFATFFVVLNSRFTYLSRES